MTEQTQQPEKAAGHYYKKSSRPRGRGLTVAVIALLLLSLACNGLLLHRVRRAEQSLAQMMEAEQSLAQTVEEMQPSIQAVEEMQSASQDLEAAVSSTVSIAVYQSEELDATGSGVIYEAEGQTVYVITCYHVIDGSDSIEVLFQDGSSVPAELVGGDQTDDIALLKLTVDFEVRAIPIGDSDALKQGDTVYAIGSPLSLKNAGTVTQGIVSATNRVTATDADDDNYAECGQMAIQTDAAVNSGNSGGALVNAGGELVGIVYLKCDKVSTGRYTSETVDGMGYALPINYVIRAVTDIRNTGKVTHPTVGIGFIPLNKYSEAELVLYGLRTDLEQGLSVSTVESGSPADLAGLQTGDVITHFDGYEVEGQGDFLARLHAKQPGDTVTFTVNRDGQSLDLPVTLG